MIGPMKCEACGGQVSEAELEKLNPETGEYEVVAKLGFYLCDECGEEWIHPRDKLPPELRDIVRL